MEMTVKPLTDDELLALIMDLESDRAERKQAWRGDAPEKGRQAVCAFANDLPNRSLVPMAQEVRKPIFQLSSADGAIGSHAQAVRDAWSDFKALAVAIEAKIDPA